MSIDCCVHKWGCRLMPNTIYVLFVAIEADYEGPKLEDGVVTLEFMKHLMEWYKNEKKLHKNFAYRVSPSISKNQKLFD